jgi:hypothetical protein
MFFYYKTNGSLPLENRRRKRANKFYLDNENVFVIYRTWLLAQKIAIVIPNGFLYAINMQIIPRLLANAKKSLLPKAKKAWKPFRHSVVYIWLYCFGFYKTKEKRIFILTGIGKRILSSINKKISFQK